MWSSNFSFHYFLWILTCHTKLGYIRNIYYYSMKNITVMFYICMYLFTGFFIDYYWSCAVVPGFFAALVFSYGCEICNNSNKDFVFQLKTVPLKKFLQFPSPFEKHFTLICPITFSPISVQWKIHNQSFEETWVSMEAFSWFQKGVIDFFRDDFPTNSDDPEFSSFYPMCQFSCNFFIF